jgi:hypothetical protein
MRALHCAQSIRKLRASQSQGGNAVDCPAAHHATVQTTHSDCAAHHFGRPRPAEPSTARNDAKVSTHSNLRLRVKFLLKIGGLGYVLIALLFFICGFAH